MLNGSSLMKKSLLVALFFLFFGCEEELSHSHPMPTILYLYNNSNVTVQVKGYKEVGLRELNYELTIPPNEVEYAGYLDMFGTVFSESDKLAICKGKDLVYDISASSSSDSVPSDIFHQLFSEWVRLSIDGRVVLVAPVFKWCENELCENN